MTWAEISIYLHSNKHKCVLLQGGTKNISVVPKAYFINHVRAYITLNSVQRLNIQVTEIPPAVFTRFDWYSDHREYPRYTNTFCTQSAPNNCWNFIKFLMFCSFRSFYHFFSFRFNHNLSRCHIFSSRRITRLNVSILYRNRNCTKREHR